MVLEEMELNAITQETRNALFSVIRCGLGQKAPDYQLSSTRCDELLAIGTRQSILPILYHGLREMNLPLEYQQKFDEARLRDIRKSILRDHALGVLQATLDKNRIPYILLKGSVIRNLYPEPTMRTSSDIDILVHEEDTQKAVLAIEAETDFKAKKNGYHDISMMNADVHLELHFNIKENLENIDKLLREAWNFARETGEGDKYTFSPEYQIFHVIAHMSHHFLNGGLGIRPFLDLWLLRTKTEYDEEKVCQMCAECGILTFYQECSHLTQVWMENDKHTEATELLEEICLSGGVFGSQQFKNAGRQRSQKGLKYLLSRVFPPAYQVKEYYKDSSGKEHSAAYYYMKRLRIWIGKSRREDLNQQIHEVMNSDRQYLNNADRLFRLLDLQNVK